MARDKRPRSLLDRESYKDFTIVMESFDWDYRLKVMKDGEQVAEFLNRCDARKWIDLVLEAKRLKEKADKYRQEGMVVESQVFFHNARKLEEQARTLKNAG